jgi:predicted nuclease of predicted toxin-antitoxin system
MRFLANENFPAASVRRLRAAGHDVVAVIETNPGAKDPVVLSLAARERLVLPTFDRDYGELIYRRGLPVPLGIVHLRLAPAYPEQAAEVVIGLGDIVGLTLEGHYTVIDPERIRQRPLP